jgi:hypothetical protein
MIVRDIHNQQVSEMERVLPDGHGPATAHGSRLRQKLGRGLVRIGYAVAAEGPSKQAYPC